MIGQRLGLQHAQQAVGQTLRVDDRLEQQQAAPRVFVPGDGQQRLAKLRVGAEALRAFD